MTKAVLDSTVLVSAFLAKAGISAELLRQAKRRAFRLYLAEEIIEETQRVLLEYQRIRKRYHYPDRSVIQFSQGLRIVAHLVTKLPQVNVIDRDPNDDMVVACALKARSHYIVTRDKDLLALGKYQKIKVITPEKFMGILRKPESEEKG
jgi:putative PIN family toxin of toxin-antitoxin system